MFTPFKRTALILLVAMGTWVICSLAVAVDNVKVDQAKGNCLVSRFIGMKVTDTAGTRLGQIRDVVLEPGQGKIAYAVMGIGGHVGIGERMVAVPLSQFSITDDRAMLSTDARQIKDLKGFEHWPRSADTHWAQQGMQGNPAPGPDHIPNEALWAFRASRLIGLRVVGLDGKDIGEIEDLVMTRGGETLRWAVISHGGVMGVGASYSAVPIQSLTVEVNPRAVHFNGDLVKLGATRIDGDDTRRFAHDPAQQQRVDGQFTRADWSRGFLGDYVAMTGHARDDTQWGAGSVYNRQYNPQTEETVTGTVESVGAFYPAADTNASDGLRLRLRTADGKMVTVHVGPRSYLDHEGVDIHSGDNLTLNGSRVEIQGRTVVIARQFTVGGKMWDVRSKDGKPYWNLNGSTLQPAAMRTDKDSQR